MHVFHVFPQGVHPPLLGSSARSPAFRVHAERCLRYRTLVAADDVSEPTEPGLAHLVGDRCHAHCAPDVTIPHSVQPRQSQGPTEHAHLHNMERLHVFGSSGPALTSIERYGANDCLVDFGLKANRHPSVAKHFVFSS